MSVAAKAALTHFLQAAGFLALAIGSRMGLRVWIGTGANNGIARWLLLGGGLVALICTGFAAAQTALGFLALTRRGDEQ